MENCVPILEITDENFNSMWPAIKEAISQSSFIALDCELSGLGNRSKLNSPEIDIRYTNIKEIAKEYSIVSLGVSCFICQSSLSTVNNCDGDKEEVKCHNYVVQTFNILTVCSTKYTVDTRSAKFLLSHGFDFNKQYMHGLPYERGEDTQIGKRSVPTVKQVFQQIIKYEKPIVLHNGFVDLLFIYQCFYAELPKNSDTFAADLLDMFPAGVYDTKYISEFHQSFQATFLEFVFKCLQMENFTRVKKGLCHCRFEFPSYPKRIKGLNWHYYLQVFDAMSEETKEEQQRPLCESYKYHGWCSEADSCHSSHNINRIVKELHESYKGKRKKATKGIASFSLAQLINMKKHKMDEVKNKMTSQTEKHLFQDRNGSKKHAIDAVIDQCSDNGNCDAHCTSGVTESGIPITSCNGLETNLPSNNINGNTSPATHSSDALSTNNISEFEPLEFKFNVKMEQGGSNSRQEEDSKSYTKSVNCSGHSAGMDAFMTGFIFACDITTLGTLPQVSSFTDPKELNLQHIVGKVYLIGKEFPFLVRSSSYNKTSSANDRIVKILRNN